MPNILSILVLWWQKLLKMNIFALFIMSVHGVINDRVKKTSVHNFLYHTLCTHSIGTTWYYEIWSKPPNSLSHWPSRERVHRCWSNNWLNICKSSISHYLQFQWKRRKIDVPENFNYKCLVIELYIYTQYMACTHRKHVESWR